ncbi:Ig-like domain repeat protein [Actinacidiphila acididurans]|uniref:Ig-like domain repeat protein n=1 Tax=Actinacidiphila acididurans TaxID=2784346 RepID=A0ABS2TRL2_9ACTN|nr:hypothetical protein [Actinacidiphila acididurans]MBM9504608.1 hypothetical protein [Actinacidiphila acididurans]
MTRRMHAALLSVLALILGTGALVLTTAGTANADLTGTVTLSPSSGTVDDLPAFTSVSVDQACPTGYQDALNVYLVMPSGDESLLASHLTNGAPFGTSPITATLPATGGNGTILRSISTAFDVASVDLADGTYPVHVVCKSSDPANSDTPTFTTAIDITGSNWAAKVVTPPTSTTLDLTANPAGHSVVSHDVTLTATVTPATAEGTVDFTVNGAPVPSGSNLQLSNGVATVTLPGISTAGTYPLTAVFTPTDPLKFGPSQGGLSYPFVAEPLLTVLDDSGNVVQDTPTLTKGQKLKVTAEGFLPGPNSASNGEDVSFTLDDGSSAIPGVTADATGKVSNYAVTLPSDLADGDHSLVLKGATSGIQQTFAFKSGADSGTTAGTTSGTTAGDTSGSTAGDTSGSTAGDTSGDTSGSTAGDTSGSTAGDTSGTTSGDTSGATAGTVSGGSDGSTGGVSGGTSGDLSGGSSSTGGSTGGSSGGGSGPLAATGAGGIFGMSALALLLLTGGGYAVYRVRRDGKLLTFGPGPRD